MLTWFDLRNASLMMSSGLVSSRHQGEQDCPQNLPSPSCLPPLPVFLTVCSIYRQYTTCTAHLFGRFITDCINTFVLIDTLIKP